MRVKPDYTRLAARSSSDASTGLARNGASGGAAKALTRKTKDPAQARSSFKA
jgi:hypothetical protein